MAGRKLHCWLMIIRNLACLLLACLASLAAADPARPNIILFLVDDMGWDDPGFMGNPYHETPQMDRLAAEGVTFTNAYAASPNCKPSRASLLTGLYPPHHGIYDALPPNDGPLNEQRLIPPPTHFRLQPGESTLASQLHELGYRSALVGKWDLGDKLTAPDRLGFDTNIGGFRGGMLASGMFSPYHLPNLNQDAPGEYITDRLTQEAVRFIDANAGTPFFLMLAHYAVHVPLEAPRNTVQHFRDKAKPDPAYNATYAAMLKHVDDSLAAIRQALDRHGLDRDTIIILASDNGPFTPMPIPRALRGNKGTLLEGGIRTPLVIHWPAGIPTARREAMPASGVDILPTVLDALGHPEAAAGVDGTSLLPCLQHKQCNNARALFWHFPAYLSDPTAEDGFFQMRPQSAIRQGPWKLIEDLETGHVQLYNLEQDAAETHDLAAAQPDTAAALRQSLDQWRMQTGAAMPTPNPAWHRLHGWALWNFQLGWEWQHLKAKLGLWQLDRSSR